MTRELSRIVALSGVVASLLVLTGCMGSAAGARTFTPTTARACFMSHDVSVDTRQAARLFNTTPGLHVRYSGLFQVTFPDMEMDTADGATLGPERLTAFVMFEPSAQAIRQAEVDWAKGFRVLGQSLALSIFVQHFEEHGNALLQWFRRPVKVGLDRRIVDACLGGITGEPKAPSQP